MQHEVDCYILEYNEKEDKYYISFTDSVNQECRIEIDKDLFEIYINSKKSYIKIKNETSRHIEHLPLTERELYKRAFYPSYSAEDTVIKNIESKKLDDAMKKLTETQDRRIELHIINKITIRDVAKLEHVKKRQIEKSLQLGLKKLRKILKNRGGQN